MLASLLASQAVPPIVQALVPLGLGIAATLMGFGLIPASLNEKKAKAWSGRWASSYRLGGPLLIVAGFVLVARAVWG